MKILLLGATGQVGWELAHTLPGLGRLITTARDASGDLTLDVGDPERLQATLDSTAADVIVNPNRPGDRFPSKHLAGVGVAFYAMVALRARLREQGLDVIEDFAEMVTAVRAVLE